jgi:hypothetical protein
MAFWVALPWVISGAATIAKGASNQKKRRDDVNTANDVNDLRREYNADKEFLANEMKDVNNNLLSPSDRRKPTQSSYFAGDWGQNIVNWGQKNAIL